MILKSGSGVLGSSTPSGTYMASPSAGLPERPDGLILAQTRSNQMLPTSWSHLTPADIAEIEKLLEPQFPTDPLELEARLAIAAIRTTGRYLENLWLLKIDWDPNALSSKARHEALIWNDGTPFWRLNVGGPYVRSGPRDPIYEDDLDQPFLSQLLTMRVDAWVGRLIDVLGIPQKKQSRLFNANIPELRSAIELALTNRRSGHNARPRKSSRTVASIERYLGYDLTHRYGGDCASAMRLTGRDMRPGRSGSYYGDHALNQSYAGVEQNFASVRTPSENKVSLLISKCRDHLIASVSDVEVNHAAITYQTVALVSFATAHRNEGEELPSSTAIDPETGFCKIHDKDTGNPNKARLIWVPDVARAQIRAYERHLAKIVTQLDADSVKFVNDTLEKNRLPTFRLEGSTAVHRSLENIWIALNKDLGILFPFECNAGRHWLRTRMVSRCSSETIQAFMGHWLTGCEPWSLGSCLDPLLYRSELEMLLPSVLADAGWEALDCKGQPA